MRFGIRIGRFWVSQRVGRTHYWYADGRDASQKSPLNWLRSPQRARLFAPPPA